MLCREDLLCQHAAVLEKSGQTEDARATYMAALAVAPDHAATLTALGALLARTGYKAAARTIYQQLTSCHPNDPAGHVHLATLLHEEGEDDAAWLHYHEALRASPGYPEAHQGIGNIHAARGDHVAAEQHWQLGYRDRVFNVWRYCGQAAPIRVLLLISVAGGNLRARSFLDDTIFAVTAIAMEFFTPAHALPPHDLVVNAVSDAELCGTALAAAAALVARTAAPVINHPDIVARTGRTSNAQRLADLPGVITPRMALLPRASLIADLPGLGFGFPLLLRAPGFHTGQHFIRAESAADLPVAAAFPGESVLAIEYLAAIGDDGCARKGRVMIIDGRLYPLHWAISAQWKVHYFTATMAENPDHRAEEARFLSDMPGFLGDRAQAALAAIAAALGLDYGGIDFALGPDGDVLLFEANATMFILPPPAGAMWDYRRAAATNALDAVRRMLVGRASA